MKNPKKKRRNRRKSRISAILIALVVVALLFGGYKVGRWLETRHNKPEVRGEYQQYNTIYQPTIEVDEATYRQRNDLTTILLIGVDRESDAVSSGYRNGGQVDFLDLLVIDEEQKRISQLSIDRDTMTPITVLGVLGNQTGVRTAQISLSHGFGDGGAQSCELTVDAVSNLLLGTHIDKYIALNMDGISVLNDAVGGVTVTLKDDFSALDPAMTPGTTLTLMGDQAEYYVRSRMSMSVGTNEARMERQREYVSQMTQQLKARIQESKSFINTIFDLLDSYLTTDMSRGLLLSTVWNIRDYENVQLELSGEHVVAADGFMEFYVDETDLQQKVLELFYQNVE